MTSPARSFKSAAYGLVAEVGKALASPARLELLELLAQAPHAVEALATETGQSFANTSHHLQQLSRAQLVTRERRGQQVVYALAGPDVAALLAQLHAVAATHVAALDQLTRDFFVDHDTLEALDRDALLARLERDDVVLIDVRPTHEFDAGHLPGALSVPLATLAEQIADLPRDKLIIAYCRGPFCTFSADAVSQLRARGFQAQRASLNPHQDARS